MEINAEKIISAMAIELAKEDKRSVLKQKNEKEVKNITTEFSEKSDTIIIPKGMTKLEAAKELELQHKDEEKVVNKVQTFDGWISRDVVVAAKRVSDRTFGWLNGKSKFDMFGNEIKPSQVKIQTDIDKWEDCYVGQFTVGAWDDAIVELIVNPHGAYVKVEGKKKFDQRIDAYFADILAELKSNSIYKGKSLIWSGGDNFSFIENRGSDEIVLNKNEQLVLDNFIIKPLLSGKREKRGILFSGPYGTGKTETALKIGRVANENGHTFIYCKDNDLSEILEVAKHYQPSVVFVEDIDEMTSGDRDEDVNDLLNTIDGIQTKGQALTLIMTTNHKEKINQAFRRPGRIDVVLNFDLPEKDTVAEMYKRFLNNAKGINYKELAKKTPRVQGAVIKEIANRAMLSVGKGETLSEKHVEMSIELTRMQIDFMSEPAIIHEDSIDKKLAGMMAEKVKQGLDAYYS